MTTSPTAVLVSVNVGTPRDEQWEGRTVRTGIYRHASVRPGDQLNAASPRGESVLLDETCPVLPYTSITPLIERPISTGWREIVGPVVFMLRPAEEAGSGGAIDDSG
jgi:hypothetical protein